jgi:hypothetical protein
MNKPCTQWESWIEQGLADVETASPDHLERCPTCREQWSAHLMLSGLGELPVPELSCDLGSRLRHAVAATAADSLLSTRARQIMRVYWLLATFLAGVILAQLGPVSAAWLALALGVGILTLAGMPALVLLRRRFSWNLMDLVIWTLR